MKSHLNKRKSLSIYIFSPFNIFSLSCAYFGESVCPLSLDSEKPKIKDNNNTWRDVIEKAAGRIFITKIYIHVLGLHHIRTTVFLKKNRYNFGYPLARSIYGNFSLLPWLFSACLQDVVLENHGIYHDLGFLKPYIISI